MDFTFSADQKELHDALGRFLMTEVPPELLRELAESRTGRTPALGRALASQGLNGLSVPQACGGLGLGDLEWGLLSHAIGYYAVPDPIADTALIAAGMLAALAPDCALRRNWLPRIAAGEARIAIGHPVNPLVADAHVADLLLLEHEGELHALSLSDATLVAVPSVDGTRRLFEVEWQPSPRSLVIGGHEAAALWADAVDRGALSAAGQLLGLSARMLDLSIDHAAARRQFGKPIGTFQAVKHLIADVTVCHKFARPVVFRAAHSMALADAHRSVHVSHAKLAAGRSARLAAKNAIQVHGAMGYTWEADLQVYMKRAWALDGVWGDVAFHKQRVGAFVLDDDALLGPGHTFDLDRRAA